MVDPELELEAELESLMATLTESEGESELEDLLEFLHESESESELMPPDEVDRALVKDQMGRGVNDENKITDAIFYDHHPAWRGKSLRNASAGLRQEWIQIRDRIVRPMIRIQAAPPTAPKPAPVVKPSAATPSPGAFGFSTFSNIRTYAPDQYQPALAAQVTYQKVSRFLPYYQKISNAAPRVFISEAHEGIGNLVFSMDTTSFTNLVDDPGLRNEALKIVGGALTSELVFTEDVIGALGIGFTMLEIAQGLNNHNMLRSFGSEHDKWMRWQQLQFVFGLIAEDISRQNWGNGYFSSPNSRDLAVEVANEFAAFQPIYLNYMKYWTLDANLGKYQGNIPDRMPQTMNPAP